MERWQKWRNLAIPAGWEEVIVRTVMVAVVTFVVMHAKEWFDAGRFDTPDIVIDTAWMAGGNLVLNAILMWVKPARKLMPQ